MAGLHLIVPSNPFSSHWINTHLNESVHQQNSSKLAICQNRVFVWCQRKMPSNIDHRSDAVDYQSIRQKTIMFFTNGALIIGTTKSMFSHQIFRTQPIRTIGHRLFTLEYGFFGDYCKKTANESKNNEINVLDYHVKYPRIHAYIMVLWICEHKIDIGYQI